MGPLNGIQAVTITRRANQIRSIGSVAGVSNGLVRSRPSGSTVPHPEAGDKPDGNGNRAVVARPRLGIPLALIC